MTRIALAAAAVLAAAVLCALFLLPPRRLTLLHLDGSENLLPQVGSELRLGEKVVGHVGTSARHHELGPVALGMVKRNVPVDATLLVDGIPAAQEPLVDPEVGLHVRPRLGGR